MIQPIKMRGAAVAAALMGFALRLGFVGFFPTEGGDSPAYLQFARNLLDAHIFGLQSDGRIVPTDARPPGYPLFVAAVYSLAGRSETALLVAQALVDVATCFLIAALAARLAPEPSRDRVRMAALWLAVLCPFTANYTAVPLTEVLAVALSAATTFLLVRAWQREELQGVECDRRGWLLAGIAAGLATLVRAESPLLLAAAGAAIALACAKRRAWLRIVRTGIWLAAGLLLPLAPWAARNAITLGRVQFLAARYAEMPGEFVPRGFYAWTDTWLVHFRDVYLVSWKLEEQPILVNDLPANAFDSPEERERVAHLLEEHNDALEVSPELDAQFAALAHERTARHPLRTWLWVPLERIGTLWLTPRVELLPFTGEVRPLAEKWEYDREDLLVTLTLSLVNLAYLLLALAGCWAILRGRTASTAGWNWHSHLSSAQSLAPPGAMFLVAYVVVRTLFLTQVETPEQRYVLVCFPAVIALAAQLWRREAPATVRDAGQAR
ncbi:MAG TPA: glycosyltransferase family 39 protein [Candidatus Acidoferrales bacterium]|nr:glycosyltransferase family 39 protein [Candidatus Acidoferrales bacterium]